MKGGRPSRLALTAPPDENTITGLMRPDGPSVHSTPEERCIATGRLLDAGVDRTTIAELLDVNAKTVRRYVRRLREGS